MTERAIEFVETWVSEKIEKIGHVEEIDDAEAQAWAAECTKDALDEGIPASELNDAFDDLPAFMAGQVEEAVDREEDEDDEDDEEDDGEEDDEEDDGEEDDEDGKE